MGELSWNALKQIVYERANGCCEYCQTCEVNSGQTMQVDHIDPQGDDVLENLCLSCWNCNSSKHKATLVIDPETGARVPLFNPRTQVWSEHFEWLDDGTRVCGLSSVGRATVTRLKMNHQSWSWRGSAGWKVAIIPRTQRGGGIALTFDDILK